MSVPRLPPCPTGIGSRARPVTEPFSRPHRSYGVTAAGLVQKIDGLRRQRFTGLHIAQTTSEPSYREPHPAPPGLEPYA
jgi:hypothetical protein